MHSFLEPKKSEAAELLLRLDAGHAVPDLHPGSGVLRSRRVRQVLVGAQRSANLRVRPHAEQADSEFRLSTTEESASLGLRGRSGGALRRFRDNLHTLSHIARDPLLCHAERGAVLNDLRETLYLTESALRQIVVKRHDSADDTVPSEAILAMANVVDDRVDRLFERMERLGALRQMLFRFSAILEGIRHGKSPRVHDIEELTTMVVDSVTADGQTATLLETESSEPAVRIAAHALNVSQVVARLAIAVPAWSEELSLAVGAALLQDVGMMQVPEEIFCSAEPLTPAQRALVQTHPAASASIVRQMRGRDERLDEAVYQHHEHLDGSGYPEQIRGDAVGPVARLLSVADVYVGIQSARPYRAALGTTQALAEIDRAATEGKLDGAWTCRLPSIEMHWLRIPIVPEPPSSAPAISALAA